MKKYFIKITAFLLLAFILPMIGGLCFQDLAHSIAKINIAHAADNKMAAALGLDNLSMDNMDMAGINTDVCSEGEINDANLNFNLISPLVYKTISKVGSTQNLKTKTPLSAPQNNNAVLPCCVGGAHPDLITSAQSLEIHKLVSFTVYNLEKLPLNISEVIFYQAPLSAPPELKSLQTTILRI